MYFLAFILQCQYYLLGALNKLMPLAVSLHIVSCCTYFQCYMFLMYDRVLRVEEPVTSATHSSPANTCNLIKMEDRRSIRLHRCRFVDWSPSPITAIAFPPSPLPALKFAEETLPVLAIGHANGNIEIWKWTGLATPAKTSQGWVLSQASLLNSAKVR
jgi:hypothetical protein